MPFDVCVHAGQLPIAAELARTCDDQTLILDHCGVPDIAGNNFDDWAGGIDALAALPHVNVKLSGITAYCAPGKSGIDTLKPWVDHVIDRFTPARMVWGGDWPVVNLGSGLPEWIAISKQLLAGLSEDEQTAIASGNAARIYGVSLK